MVFSIYNSITMEKTKSSPEETMSSFLAWALVHVFLYIITDWVVPISKFLPRIESLFKSKFVFDNSIVRVEESLNSELDHQEQVFVGKKDDGNLSREDKEMVMERFGLFCSHESEELKDSFGSEELYGLFEEKEPSLEEVKEAFDVFDQNRDGFIDAKELQRVLCLLGLKEGSELQDCKKMIKTFDENRDGKIDFHEFVKFMEKNFC